METKALQAGLATHNRETTHIKLLKPITLAQAKQFATELRSLIDTQDAAHRLGLNKRVFEPLVRRGFIKSSRKTRHGPLAMQLRAAKVLPHKDVHGAGNIYRRSEVFEPR